MARKQHVPWRAAGTASEQQPSADDVVRETGWVFNNVTGHDLSLAEFVSTGDHEVGAFLQAFELPSGEGRSIVEIGSGIGRMTAAFTRHYRHVIASDLDAAFLERCRETVAQFGIPGRLSTVSVPDGRTLDIADGAADVVFSYITLQHCHREDAIALTREAVRVARPGGRIALNYRTWVDSDVILWPAGKVVRALWKVPLIGGALARWRVAARVGWQANRLTPMSVLQAVGPQLANARIVRSPQRRPYGLAGVTDAVFEGVNRSHWWLVADVATPVPASVAASTATSS
ncbi:MAG: putative methyltransferase [Ilumatobacteraceae bacterium]|jgi:ubiquinone/menaquinone biosynthesis C-methylase UbiE|nr:putative methyltransferase [Ilumatobacteraceae bacterium]